MLLGAAERLSLSARGYHRVMKVSRTIADLDGDASITVMSVAEALHYRPVAHSGVPEKTGAAVAVPM